MEQMTLWSETEEAREKGYRLSDGMDSLMCALALIGMAIAIALEAVGVWGL